MATGGTFNQNAVSMASAAVVLTQLWTPELCRAHNAKGDWLRERINELSQAHGAPCQAHGCGSLVNITFRARPLFEEDGATMLPDWRETRVSAALGSSLFFFAMLERGYLVGTPGSAPSVHPSIRPSIPGPHSNSCLSLPACNPACQRCPWHVLTRPVAAQVHVPDPADAANGRGLRRLPQRLRGLPGGGEGAAGAAGGGGSGLGGGAAGE